MPGQGIAYQVWGSMYNFGLEITLPAGTYEWTDFEAHDLMHCQAKVVTGGAFITMEYERDSWGSIVEQTMTRVRVNDLTLSLENSSQYNFGDMHHSFGESEAVHSNITQWIALCVRQILNSTDIKADLTKSPYAQTFGWGYNTASGRYDPALIWKTVATAVSIARHYVLDQSDGMGKATTCPYNGKAGIGVIFAPQWIPTLLVVILVCGVFMQIVVVASWLLVVGGGSTIDRCVEMIDDPLRTMYYMRDSCVMSAIRGSDIGRISLEKHVQKIHVRFGEGKRTRGSEMGKILLDEPSKVVKTSRTRKVQ